MCDEGKGPTAACPLEDTVGRGRGFDLDFAFGPGLASFRFESSSQPIIRGGHGSRKVRGPRRGIPGRSSEADTHPEGAKDASYAPPRKRKTDELATRPIPPHPSRFATKEMACLQETRGGIWNSWPLVGFMGICDIKG